MARQYEVPPTAGLPPSISDLFTSGGDLADMASRVMGLTSPQVECSGTASLVIALNTLKKSSTRSEVIIPAYTCPLVPIAIAHCGLQVKLCDLAPDDFDLDINQLASLVTENTLAVLPTHLGGRIADIGEMKKQAAPFGVTVIEDAAQALGADVGKHGDITFYSLAVGKGLSTFEGGLMTANNAELRQRLLETSQNIIPSDMSFELRRCIELIGYTFFYNPKGLHYVYGQTRRKALQAKQPEEAIGDVFDFDIPLHRVSRWRQKVGATAMKRLPEFIEQTGRQALKRCDRLDAISGIRVIRDKSDARGVWPFLMVLMPDRTSRDAALKRLWPSPLGVTRLFMHALPDYNYLGKIVPATLAPNARDFANRMLTISNSLWLDEERFEKICQTLELAVSRKK